MSVFQLQKSHLGCFLWKPLSVCMQVRLHCNDICLEYVVQWPQYLYKGRLELAGITGVLQICTHQQTHGHTIDKVGGSLNQHWSEHKSHTP